MLDTFGKAVACLGIIETLIRMSNHPISSEETEELKEAIVSVGLDANELIINDSILVAAHKVCKVFAELDVTEDLVSSAMKEAAQDVQGD